MRQGCDNVKIGEAQKIYREQIREYREQKTALSKRLQDVRTRIDAAPEANQKKQFESEAVTLELTLDALDEKQTEYQEYMDKLSDKYCAYWNATVAEQQADAMEEYGIEMGKIMEVARRIMKGGVVPAADEKKLMEFSFEMYQTAKNVGAMVRREKREEYDSLWGDEEEKEYDDPQEVAENAQAPTGAPQVVSVADTTASATGES